MDVRQQILEQAPRFARSDAFAFACHPELDCFNACCRELTVELSPADCARLRRGLDLSSTELLARHTRTRFDPQRGLPVVLLRMRDDADQRCPFVGPAGCRVYEARPAACRLYPVGRATAAAAAGGAVREFFFLIEEQPCLGFGETRRWTVQQWLEDQGVDECDRLDEPWRAFCQHPALRQKLDAGEQLTPRALSEVQLALYDIDRFRAWLAANGELERIGASPALRRAIADDDGALLRFALDWLTRRLLGRAHAGNG
jgi:hypothetical protein